MKQHLRFGLLALVLLPAMFGFTPKPANEYKIGSDFVIKAEGHEVAATFHSLKGTIRFDPADLASSFFDVEVAAGSIQTGIDLKNSHAMSKQWLDAEKFPAIRFKSQSIKVREGGFVTYGNLDLHGIQQGIELPFQFVDNVFSGEFDIMRSDFKIGKPKSGIAPRLHITLQVPVTPAP